MSRSDPVRQWLLGDHIDEASELMEEARVSRKDSRSGSAPWLVAEAQAHIDMASLKFAMAQRGQGAAAMSTDPDVMEIVVRNACMSADTVAMERGGRTPAQQTRAVVRRALEALEANGLITITPVKDWPDGYIIDPPYIDPFALVGES